MPGGATQRQALGYEGLKAPAVVLRSWGLQNDPLLQGSWLTARVLFSFASD